MTAVLIQAIVWVVLGNPLPAHTFPSESVRVAGTGTASWGFLDPSDAGHRAITSGLAESWEEGKTYLAEKWTFFKRVFVTPLVRQFGWNRITAYKLPIFITLVIIIGVFLFVSRVKKPPRDERKKRR